MTSAITCSAWPVSNPGRQRDHLQTCVPEYCGCSRDSTYPVWCLMRSTTYWRGIRWLRRLIADFSAIPPRERNLLRLRFLAGSDQRDRFGDDATNEFARETTADLRAATGRYPEDPSIADLVADLLAGSEEFARIWARHEVATQQSLCQTIIHPTVGRIDTICEVLVIPERDQRVVLYTAEPGSPSEDALRLLEVIGTQSLEIS